MGAITFAGRTYDSVDEMPPDVRQAYERVMAAFADTGQSGMLDIWEMEPQIIQFKPQQSAPNDVGKPKELREKPDPGCSTAEEEPSKPEESPSER